MDSTIIYEIPVFQTLSFIMCRSLFWNNCSYGIIKQNRVSHMTNLLETLDMKIESEQEGKVVLSMPVSDKVKQPLDIYMEAQV